MRVETPFFITVHGIDGTGKTTTSRALSESLFLAGQKTFNYDEYETVAFDNPFSSIKKRIVKETSPNAQLAFYLGSTMFHSDAITHLLSQGFSVVKSRYLDDVLAHHAHLGVLNGEQIAALFPIVQPDLKVILTVNEDLRRERLKARGEKDWKDRELRESGSRLDFFENYLLEKSQELINIGKALRIDTSQLQVSEVVERIVSQLLELREDRHE